MLHPIEAPIVVTEMALSLILMTTAKDEMVQHESLAPVQLFSLLDLDDDTLECTIEWRLAEARNHPESDPPFQAANVIAQICTRLRSLTLGRSNYWRDLRICERTPMDEVKLVLARGGTISPINIFLEMGPGKKFRSPYGNYSPEQYPAYPDGYLLAYAVSHRARVIELTRGSWDRPPPEVEPTMIKPADYDSRPLEYISFNGWTSDAMLQLIGPRLERLDLRHISALIPRGWLEQVIIAASRLNNLTLEGVAVTSQPVTGEPILAVPSIVHPRDRVRCLSSLVLADVKGGGHITEILRRYYSLTSNNSPYVLLAPSDMENDIDDIARYTATWVDLEALGSPKFTSFKTAGNRTVWDFRFSEDRQRVVRIPGADLEVPSLLRSFIESTLAVTQTFEVRDEGIVTLIFWFNLWCGNTWAHLTQLEIVLEHLERYGTEGIEWRRHGQPRINLPVLQTLVIMTLHENALDEKYGFLYAVVLDMLDIPSGASIDIRRSCSDVEMLWKLIDGAYLVRYGRSYFDREK